MTSKGTIRGVKLKAGMGCTCAGTTFKKQLESYTRRARRRQGKAVIRAAVAEMAGN